MSSGRTFLLIHGAWHGAWCWHKIAPLLEARGHRVIAPDLPSMGADTTDAATVTLDSWTRFIADLAPADTTLVGHSRGGALASMVAEAHPERIRRLVYLSAYLLPAGRSVAAEARADADSLIPANMIPAASGITCSLRAEIIRAAFHGCCSASDHEYAVAHLSPEPLKPLVSPVKISPERFGRVPRAYIECTRDRTITLDAQRRMQAALPCETVLTLDTDHSPFLSRPQELAGLLDGL